ncbi:quinone oxidoreductase family protein [Streptomyces sp. NPDC001415]
MKALVIEEFGGPEVIHLAELADPEPGPGEVRVRVSTVVVGRTKDIATRAGRPPFAGQVPGFPHVLGSEHAGVVDAVGPGADPALIGRRVAVSAVLSCGSCRACRALREEACSSFALIGVHRQGSYAHSCVAPQTNVSLLPDDVPFTQAAALAGNGPVARAQLDAGLVGPGSNVLVIGAAGSLGATAASLAGFRGAHVIGVDRLAVKPGCLDGLPLRAALDGDAEDLAGAIREVTGEWGVDCVIDNLGIPAVWHKYRETLADMGRIVVSGAISHEPIPLPLLPFYLHSQSLIGVRTGNRTEIAALWRDVADGFRIPERFVDPMPWESVGDAHRAVEAGVSRGQAVLEVGD